MALVAQRTLDQLGTPLHEVTFCVVDVETTGEPVSVGAITEIGAVKLRGGACLGTFATLVNPGRAIPTPITVLTGITDAMVLPAPGIDQVLPPFLEFLGDAVIVGHNVRYDLSFLGAALERSGEAALANRWVDTCGLARRLVADEVPNCKLSTLATRLRLPHRPCHRALDDALATGDLLHLLLERAGRLGVTGLDDLLGLPTIAAHPQVGKLRLTDGLPRAPGVYVFRDRHGQPLYVGKATNLRARVRSYFSSDQRRKVGQLLRETERIDHRVCAAPLEADVLEVRLIHELGPRFNRQGTRWRKYVYLVLTTGEPFPRLSVVRKPRRDGSPHLGPFSSTAAARRAAEAIETAVPLRRCTGRPERADRDALCSPAQLGVATCPCAGQVTAAEYAALVARVVRGLRTDPALLLEPLAQRLARLAREERFEEAADLRDRAASLALALRRQRTFDALRDAGRVVLEAAAGGAELRSGRLVRSWTAEPGGAPLPFTPDALHDPGPAAEGPLPFELVDELSCVASWLDKHAAKVRLVETETALALPLPRLPTFTPAKRSRSGA